MATQVNTGLNTVGYTFCDGEVMAMNPKWTQALSQWKTYFSDWLNTSDPQSILDACIFFDFRCLYGKQALIRELRNHVIEASQNKPIFFYNLAQSVMKFKPPTSVLSSKSNFDIKKALLPIISFIRLYGLQNKSAETNTLLRLKDIFEQALIPKPMYDELVFSYNYLMQLRFRFQAQNILHNKLPDNQIIVAELTDIEIVTLKKIFGEINNLQTKLNFDFKGSM